MFCIDVYRCFLVAVFSLIVGAGSPLSADIIFHTSSTAFDAANQGALAGTEDFEAYSHLDSFATFTSATAPLTSNATVEDVLIFDNPLTNNNSVLFANSGAASINYHLSEPNTLSVSMQLVSLGTGDVTISVFDASNNLLDSTTQSSLIQTRAFLGITSDSDNIARINIDGAGSMAAGGDDLSIYVDSTAVPEPATNMMLTALGLAGFYWKRRNGKSKPS